MPNPTSILRTATLAGVLSLAPELNAAPSPAPFDVEPEQKLIRVDPFAFDAYGSAVDIDGSRLIVGAPFDDAGNNDVGTAYIWVRSTLGWTREAKLSALLAPANGWFGADVQIDGDIAVVSAPNTSSTFVSQGRVHIYRRSGTDWNFETFINSPQPSFQGNFGWSIALEGGRLVVGERNHNNVASDAGAVHVYEVSGTTWSLTATLFSSSGASGDKYGSSVALSGNTIAVGAPQDNVGAGVDVGSINVYIKNGANWNLQANIVPFIMHSGNEIGSAVAIDGDTLAFTATGWSSDRGILWIYTRSGGSWTEQEVLPNLDGSPGDLFGTSVSLTGDRCLVGAPFADIAQAPNGGRAHLFTRTGADWVESQVFGAFDQETGDQFGTDVALEDDTLIVGGPAHDHGALNDGTAWTFELNDNYDSFCNGDGGDQLGCTSCPCSNDAPVGTVGGCINEVGTSARMVSTGTPSASNDTMRFQVLGAKPVSFALLSSGTAAAPANASNPCFGSDSGSQSAFFNGLRCVVQSVQRHGSRPTDFGGNVGYSTNGWGSPNGPAGGLIADGGFPIGSTRYFQVVYREDPHGSCTQSQNTTQGVATTILP